MAVFTYGHRVVGFGSIFHNDVLVECNLVGCKHLLFATGVLLLNRLTCKVIRTNSFTVGDPASMVIYSVI